MIEEERPRNTRETGSENEAIREYRENRKTENIKREV